MNPARNGSKTLQSGHDRLRGNEGDDLMGLFQIDRVLAVYLKKVSAVKFFHHPCLSSLAFLEVCY